MRKLTNEYVRAYVKAHFEHMFIEEDKDYFHIKTKMLQFHQSVLHSMGYETFINEDMSLRVTKIKEEPEQPEHEPGLIVYTPTFSHEYLEEGDAIEIIIDDKKSEKIIMIVLVVLVDDDKLWVTKGEEAFRINIEDVLSGRTTIRRLS